MSRLVARALCTLSASARSFPPPLPPSSPFRLPLSASAPCLRSKPAYVSVFTHTVRFSSSSQSTVPAVFPQERMRNIAIIAHVDHGKTSLVDKLLEQSGSVEVSEERVMDSNVLEKERGITIFSKCAAITLQRPDGLYRINIVDTPGHADFGGEVERVLSMVDGVVLVVDANEGPMAQTKYVLQKALRAGKRAVVVLNKVDRPGAYARINTVESELLDLFGAHLVRDEQLEYPTLYASARQGWALTDSSAVADPSKIQGNMQPLYDAILKDIPAPRDDRGAPFSFLVTQLSANAFLGKCLTGKIHSGKVRTGDVVQALDKDGKMVSESRIIKLFVRRGLDQVIVEEAAASEIVTIAGFPMCSVNYTLCAPGGKALPGIPVDPPTLAMTFGVNDSPFAGQEGSMLTSNMISDRLYRECDSNVSLQIVKSEGDSMEVRGRGELQLGILLETMRREGFEIAVSSPRVLLRKDEDGKDLEPIEELTLDMDLEHTGLAIEKLSMRKGELKSFDETETGRARLLFEIPMRGLIGFQREFKNDTHGSGIITHRFHSWALFKGDLEIPRKGVMISMAAGECTGFALENLEQRGVLFVAPATKVYAGMIIGEHARDMDLDVNPVKGRHLSNVRTTMKDEFVRLSPPRPITLENAMSYIQDDELMEVTPTSVRLRKKELDVNRRRAMNRKKKSETE